MSCFMMPPDTLAALAKGIEVALNVGFNFLGLEAPESLGIELLDCADKYRFYSEKQIYSRLYDLNRRAYAGRYPGEPDIEPVPDMPKIPALLHYAEYDPDSGCRIITEEHYKYLKLLECLIYQCCEDATIKDPLFLALQDFRRNWMAFIIRNNPIFAALPWGSL